MTQAKSVTISLSPILASRASTSYPMTVTEALEATV